MTTQWPLKRAAHFTSLVWVCVVWRSESLMELSALWLMVIKTPKDNYHLKCCQLIIVQRIDAVQRIQCWYVYWIVLVQTFNDTCNGLVWCDNCVLFYNIWLASLLTRSVIIDLLIAKCGDKRPTINKIVVKYGNRGKQNPMKSIEPRKKWSTFSNGSPWIKISEFGLNLHWVLFPIIQITRSKDMAFHQIGRGPPFHKRMLTYREFYSDELNLPKYNTQEYHFRQFVW